MKRSALWAALFVLISQCSWGASGAVEKHLEWMAMGETASEQQMREVGSKLPELSDSQRHDLIVEGLRSKSRAVRYQIAEMVNNEPNNARYLDLLIDLAEHDPDADVRRSAHGRVSSIDINRGMILDRKLKNDPDIFVRQSALVELARSSEPEDVRVVESALKNDHLFVKTGLARSLMFHGKPFDKSAALEGLTVDAAWFKKNPVVLTGYLSRRSPPDGPAEYFIRVIREDAIYILWRKGSTEDIPRLERAVAKEDLTGDKDMFGVRCQGTIHEIQLRQLPENQRLDYLKVKLRDSRVWVRSWAVEKLCVVKGGLELIDVLEKDPNHPAHNPALGMRHWCRKHASDL